MVSLDLWACKKRQMPAGGYTKNEEERRHLARGRPRTGAWITRAQGDPPPHPGEVAPDGPAGGGGGARLPGAALLLFL